MDRIEELIAANINKKDAVISLQTSPERPRWVLLLNFTPDWMTLDRILDHINDVINEWLTQRQICFIMTFRN